jgi:hypothetical protein
MCGLTAGAMQLIMVMKTICTWMQATGHPRTRQAYSGSAAAAEAAASGVCCSCCWIARRRCGRQERLVVTQQQQQGDSRAKVGGRAVRHGSSSSGSREGSLVSGSGVMVQTVIVVQQAALAGEVHASVSGQRGGDTMA